MKFFSTLTLSILILLWSVNAFAGKSEYKLQPTDVITINVHGQPDLTTKTRVTADGFITFPLVGKIAVSGLTIPELEQKLKELLEKDYLVNAQVLAFIEEYNTRQVSVIGEVKSPGKYALPGEKEMTLMQAIAMAGGFTKIADLTKTKVMRMEDGKKRTIIINAKDITEKGDKDKDIILQAEDIVVVSESFF
ncbi:MAG: polysaccharide export protein [Candidatus Omnitrophica bacterium]|nr:polysaccharide export protein [Candidatus Omnitrophota bacterium]